MQENKNLDRSAIMRAVRSKNTAPERAVRKILRGFAPGYRLHRRELPGAPDIVYLGQKCAIFVHGCFWHGHHCRRGARTPKTHQDYWVKKIAATVERDAKHSDCLKAAGWRVCIIWECDLKNLEQVEQRLREFLDSR